MRLAIPLALLALAVPIGGPAAGAVERALTPDEFAGMVAGRTLRFDRHGAPFGAEQYLDDRRVIWEFEDGTCQRGIWFANAAGEICFVYEEDPAPQCWSFIEMPGGSFHARLSGDAPSEDLVTRDVGDGALDCPAPDIGV